MDLFLQLLADGLVRGSNIVLLALGFSLAFSVSGVFHFAHGAIYTLAAYIFYQLYSRMEINPVLAVLGTFVACTLLGMGIEVLLYRPLRNRGTSRLLLLLVSIGTLLIVQSIIAMIWGSSTLRFFSAETLAPSETVHVGPFVMSYVRIITFVVCMLISAVFYFYFLCRTKTGVAIRALISDPVMARVVGVNRARMMTLTFFLASALAVPGSILMGWEEGFVPGGGFSLILYSFIAMVCGGLGSIPGTVAGGLLMGVVASLAHWKLGGQWESAVVFLFFLIFIVLRPHGIFGYKIRSAEL